MDDAARKDYWRANLRLMLSLLAVWALVSFGFGIILKEPLDAIVINDFPLGFWFAQQGSIYTFVVLIGIYVWRMDKLDETYGVSDSDLAALSVDTAAGAGSAGDGARDPGPASQRSDASAGSVRADATGSDPAHGGTDGGTGAAR